MLLSTARLKLPQRNWQYAHERVHRLFKMLWLCGYAARLLTLEPIHGCQERLANQKPL